MCFERLIRIEFAVCLLVALAVFSQPRTAYSQASVFQVSGIMVDATAETATQAREQALAEGHLLAYEALMSRLVLQVDRQKLPSLSQNQIVDMVQDFSVTEERTSAVRYLAELSFRFSPDAVRNLFRTYRVRFTESRAQTMVVLPVFEGEAGSLTSAAAEDDFAEALEAEAAAEVAEESGEVSGDEAGVEVASDPAVLLWEENNPWYLVWVSRLLDEELVPMIVPLGDLGDVAAIDAERALAGDADALFGIAQRYGAEQTLVARAVLTGDPEAGTAELAVTAERYGDSGELVFDTRFAQQGPAPLDDLLAVASGQLIVSLREAWKAENHVSFDEQRVMTVVVPITALDDWLEVKDRLGDVSGVMGAELMYLSRKFARADISFMGDEDRLTRALERKDLMLSPSALSGWELRLSSRVFGESEPLFPPEPETLPAGEVSSGEMSGESMESEAMESEEMLLEEAPSEELMEEIDESAAESVPSVE